MAGTTDPESQDEVFGKGSFLMCACMNTTRTVNLARLQTDDIALHSHAIQIVQQR